MVLTRHSSYFKRVQRHIRAVLASNHAAVYVPLREWDSEALRPLHVEALAHILARIVVQCVYDGASQVCFEYSHGRITYVVDGVEERMCAPPMMALCDLVRAITCGASLSDKVRSNEVALHCGDSRLAVCVTDDVRSRRLRLVFKHRQDDGATS